MKKVGRGCSFLLSYQVAANLHTDMLCENVFVLFSNFDKLLAFITISRMGSLHHYPVILLDGCICIL